MHVNGGTFLPIKAENVFEHSMHSEFGAISKNSAEFFNNASITTNDIKIASDSIYYDEIKKSILTLGNVVLTDTINNLLISSNEAIFLEVEEKMTFKKEPCLKLMSNDDTLTVYSKIFESYSNKGETTIHAKSKQIISFLIFLRFIVQVNNRNCEIC